MEGAAATYVESSTSAASAAPPAAANKVEEPLWIAPKFDVKKKPPPVPKPRYVIARPPPASPQVDAPSDSSTSASGSPLATSLPFGRPRWGQLDEKTHYSPHTIHGAIFEDGADDPLTHVCPNAVGLILLGTEEPRQSTSSIGQSPISPKPPPHGYKATWQRWRSIPSTLEEKLQELLRPSPQPPLEAQPPSKEALDFLESLLSGTEPSTALVKGKSKTASGAKRNQTQTLESLDHSRLQADAAQRKHRGHEEASPPTASKPSAEPVRKSLHTPTGAEHCPGAPAQQPRQAEFAPNDTHQGKTSIKANAAKAPPEVRPPTTQKLPQAPSEERGLRPQPPCRRVHVQGRAGVYAHELAAQNSQEAAGDVSKPANDPKSSSQDGSCAANTDFQHRMREKEDEHKRRLRELEEEMEREQHQLLKEMEREQEEHSARRSAQDEWKKKQSRKTECCRQEAESSARQREHAQAQAEEVWRRRWWQNWQQGEEKVQQKTAEQKEWSKSWWQQWQEQPEEDNFCFEEEEPSWAYLGPTPNASARRPAGNSQARPAPRPPPPPPKEAATSASGEQAQVLKQLIMYRRECLEERKRTWRQMCLQWHPDKCGDKAGATAMFQFLQGLKDWFLAGK